MTEIPVILPDESSPDRHFSDPVLDAIDRFERFADLENEAIRRIAVRVVFAAIADSAWTEA
jgi:hypothetical protein